MTTSFGSSTTRAEGVPLTLVVMIQNDDEGKAPYAGAAIYLWHCDRDDQYSVSLRGVSDAGQGHELREPGRDLPDRSAGGINSAVYATSGYEASAAIARQVSLDSDNVFGDGYDLQIPEVTASVRGGLPTRLHCAV